MFLAMDWQQGAALLIVGGTAGVFAWRALRPKRIAFNKGGHCGCASPGGESIGPKQSIRFEQRKGERPRVVVQNR